MNFKRLTISLAAIGVLLFAASAAYSDDQEKAPIPGRQMMSEQERDQYRTAMQALKTEEERAAYELQEADARPDIRAAFLKALDERGFPRGWPTVTRLLLDDQGRVWAQRGGPDDSSYRAWDVLGVDGRHVATLRFPAAVNLHAVRNDLAAGLRRDELDVQYIELFQIPDLF